MPQEIATTTKQEIYPVRELAASNGASYKCLPAQILNYKICSGTHCLPTIALAEEGEDYIRIGGKEEDREMIKK